MNDVVGEWPEAGLERVTRCPVCGGASRKLLHDGLRDRIFFCAPGEWRLYLCDECGSGYLDPRPTPGTLELAYRRYYTHTDDEQELGPLRRMRRALANGYHNARFGTRREPHLGVGAWLAHVIPGERAILDAQARHLARAKPGQTLLDVGCGDGYFLRFATEMGWKAEGVEPDPHAVKVARSRGLLVHEGSPERLTDREMAYDVITLNHVIEHVHDPRNLLAVCFRLLRPGGLIWVETPNLQAVGHLRYGPDWRDLDPPRHLILFNWDSLRAVLKKTGFTMETPLPGRPMAAVTFPASEAIKRREDPYLHADKSLRVRWRAWRADRRSTLTGREFITICARRPG
jgi:2-polyprenyl-3-methyl-5-hydroxy-6-metoxy-1,4-benzoquinol methylase